MGAVSFATHESDSTWKDGKDAICVLTWIDGSAEHLNEENSMMSPRFSGVLRKLCDLFGLTEDTPPVLDRPADLELPWAPGKGNAIQDTLDGIGFPWRASGQELIDRFGLVRHPAYDWEQSPITPCPLALDGLLYPISPQIFRAPSRHHVPLWFSGDVWIKNDPLANLRHAHRRITELLGPAPIGVRNNTISSIWRAGPARISLTVWPPKLQPPGWNRNVPAHERDRRLKTACSILIEPGYRRPMSVREREWLGSFTPLDEVRGMVSASTLKALWASIPDGYSQDFVCLPPLDQDDFLGRIGLSSDHEALIVCAKQLHIVPVERIVALRLQKLRPAKGGGGAFLVLLFHAAPGVERTLGISESFGDMDVLDDLASLLSNTLNLPLRVPEPQYDC
ncbi:hypothetical protein [Alcanivorax sp. 24]|uniref:hypothetical protein n=1 Tax=Alcanivorax sp. 24 TaxID=2545266 RepID=UPI00105D35AD|nr:hypothetical protein [Alcanivorax sp. 24]